MDPPPRLACQQCKSRKIKCDKGAPCSACKSADISCHTIQRARLPRGKTARPQAQGKALEARVARIESLLEQRAEISVGPNSTSRTQVAMPDGSDCKERTNNIHRKIGDFVASDFWITLSDEVCGLRKALEGDEDEAERGADALDKQVGETCSTTGVLFPRNERTAHAAPYLSPNLRATLLDLYRYRVDSVYKVFHWPTARSLVEANHAQSLGGPPSLPVRALEYAINFMALCSITASEAEEMGLGARMDMLSQYRSAAEDVFVKSNLLQGPDLILIQAFVIYLIGLRTCLSGAYTWTLVAVAVRAATALRLGEEHPGDFSGFDLQVRRRLFFAIGILDTHSALDRGTIPILPSKAFAVPPLGFNDEDMSPPDQVPSVSSPEPHEMTHTAMIYEAMICQRRLYELSYDTTKTAWDQWTKKMEILVTFENSMLSKHFSISESAGALEQLQKMSAKKITVSMQLLARRPPYRQPQDIIPPWDEFDLLSAATEVLEQHLQPMPDALQPWAWKNWVQWHALAVVLAELMVRPQDISSDRAYDIATQSFRHYARLVADSESGLLWRPIARLMRRVQHLRQSPRQVSTRSISDDAAAGLTEAKALYQTNWGNLENDNFLAVADCTTGFEPFDPAYWHCEMGENNSIDGVSHRTSWSAWDSFIQDLDYSST